MAYCDPGFDLPKYIEMWPRVRAVGAEWEGWKTIALSMLNNVATSVAAFAVGRVSGWLWGVG